MAEIDGVAYPQDFSLDSCKIITALNAPLEMRNMVVEINYFEDLYAPTITGQLLINDSSGYLNKFYFSGNEFLVLKFSKPGSNLHKIEKVFRIFGVSGRKMVKDQNENYILNFTSEETVLSEQYKISKSYKNKKISDIVKDIYKNDLLVRPEKVLDNNIEETRGVRNLIIPNLKPFEAISWLCTQAISNTSETEGSPYLFYENIEGFNFKSLQSLYKQEPYKTYKYEPKNLTMPDDNRVQDIEVEMTNVLAYETLSNFNTIESINNGAFSNCLVTVDPLRQTFNIKNFDYFEYFLKATKMNTFMTMTSAQNRKGDYANTAYYSVLKMSPTNTGQSTYNRYIKTKQPDIKDINVETTIPNRTAQIAHLNTVRYQLSVPGDPLLTVGKMIKFYLPELRTMEDGGRIWDIFYSGNFLITAVRHKLDQENKFITILEISKESLLTPYLQFDNELPAWKDIRSR